MKDQLGKLKAREIPKGRAYLTPELHKKLVLNFGTKWREVSKQHGIHERTLEQWLLRYNTAPLNDPRLLQLASKVGVERIYEISL